MVFFPVVRCDGVDDAKTDFVADESNGQLVGQDVVLRFEVGSLKSQNFGEAHCLWHSEENRLVPEDLGKAVGWEGMFG